MTELSPEGLFRVLPVLQRLLVGDLQEDKAKQEEDRKGRDRDIDRAAGELDSGDNGGSQEGRTFGEDVVDSEVFAGVFRRDDFGIIGTGQRLDRALKAN